MRRVAALCDAVLETPRSILHRHAVVITGLVSNVSIKADRTIGCPNNYKVDRIVTIVIKHGSVAMNLDYYCGPVGHQVMDAQNYCVDIVDYLARETAILERELFEGQYRALIELGCDRLRMLNSAAAMGADYLGVDTRHELRQHNRTDCRATSSIKARFFRGKIERLAAHARAAALRVPGCLDRTLTILPFNLAGNLENPVNISMAFVDAGSDVLISSFNPTSRSRQIRHSYYRKCMMEPAFIALPEYGHVFFDAEHSFVSVSMGLDIVRKLFVGEGCSVSVLLRDEVSYIVRIRKDRANQQDFV